MNRQQFLIIVFFCFSQFSTKLSNVIWFQLLKCESPAFTSRLSDSKWSVFGFWTFVGQQKLFLAFSSLHISWCCVWMCVLTRCPSPVWRWCVSWRLGSGPASGDPTAAASSGRSAPSSRGGPCRTDPPCVSNRGTDRERDRDKEGH